MSGNYERFDSNIYVNVSNKHGVFVYIYNRIAERAFVYKYAVSKWLCFFFAKVGFYPQIGLGLTDDCN